jgi:hypothetical protein
MSGTHSLFPGQIWDALSLTDNVTARAGAAIQITSSNSGSVTLTLWSGATIVVTVSPGDSIYPYQCTKFHAGTAAVVSAYNLFQ